MMALPVPTTAHLAERRCSILRKRALLDSIDTSTHAGLRDRALIGLMVYREIHCGQVFRKMQAVRLPDLVRMADKFGIAKA